MAALFECVVMGQEAARCLGRAISRIIPNGRFQWSEFSDYSPLRWHPDCRPIIYNKRRDSIWCFAFPELGFGFYRHRAGCPCTPFFRSFVLWLRPRGSCSNKEEIQRIGVIHQHRGHGQPMVLPFDSSRFHDYRCNCSIKRRRSKVGLPGRTR